MPEDSRDYVKDLQYVRDRLRVNTKLAQQIKMAHNIEKEISEEIQKNSRSQQAALILQTKLHEKVFNLDKQRELLSANILAWTARIKREESWIVSAKEKQSRLTDTTTKKYRELTDSIAKHTTKLKESVTLADEEFKLFSDINDKLNAANEIKTSDEARQVLLNEFNILRGQSAMYERVKRTLDAIATIKKKDNIRQYAAEVTMVIEFFKRTFETFKQFDKSAASFRKELGITRDTSSEIQSMVRGITIDMMNISVTADEVYGSVKGAEASFGSIHSITPQLLKNITAFKVQLGISETTSLNVLKIFSQVSRSTYDSQMHLLGFTHKLSEAGGTNLNQVMEDISAASSVAYENLSRYPLTLIKTAVEARRLGTSLRSLSTIGSTLLNFQESVNAEMEASVLLGQSINLQRARELAYRRDQAGLLKEIVSISNKFNFEKMDSYQAKAFANLLGMTTEELGKMLQTQREQARIEKQALGDSKFRKKLDDYKRLKTANEDYAKTVGQSANALLLQRSNQEILVSIQNKWNQLLAKLGEKILPRIERGLIIFDKVLTPILELTEHIVYLSGIARLLKIDLDFTKLTGGITAFFSAIGKKYDIVGKMFSSISVYAGKFVKFISPAINLFKGFFSIISEFTPMLGGLLKGLKFVPILGQILSVIHGIISATGRIFDIWSSDEPLSRKIIKSLLLPFSVIYDVFVKPIVNALDWVLGLFGVDNLGRRLLTGLEAIGESIVDVLTGSFGKAWDRITEWWGGNSPSELGLRILKGITSISAPVKDALISPYKTAFKFIGDMTKQISESQIGKQLGLSLDTPAFNTAASANTNSQNIIVNNNNEEVVAQQQTTIKLLQDIHATLKNLNLSLNLDSQQLSMGINRATQFYNGYGTNTVK